MMLLVIIDKNVNHHFWGWSGGLQGDAHDDKYDDDDENDNDGDGNDNDDDDNDDDDFDDDDDDGGDDDNGSDTKFAEHGRTRCRQFSTYIRGQVWDDSNWK